MPRTPIRLAAAAALVALIAGCEAPQPLGPAGSVAEFISRVSTADSRTGRSAPVLFRKRPRPTAQATAGGPVR